MSQPGRDWHLIVAIAGVVVALLAAVPSLYDFVKQRFFSTPHPGSSNPIVELEAVSW